MLLRGAPSRRVSMSRTGRWLLVARGDDIDLVDLLGATPTRTLPAIDGPVEFVGRDVWGLDGSQLIRISPRDLAVLPARAIVPSRPTAIRPGSARSAATG